VRPSPADALRQALAGPPPYVLADAGDATNAGTPGDSTELLRTALAHGGTGRVVLAVRDAAAAREAYTAGVGADVELVVGEGGAGDYAEATGLRGRVAAVFDGELRYTHPAAYGQRDRAGQAALVVAGGLEVVVHERTVRLIDPALYLALGIDVTAVDVLQAKSHVSYKAGFDPITDRSVVADTQGPSTANLTTLPYRRRPRPMFPFEPV
jgi:microcystin degradation protein MlrC